MNTSSKHKFSILFRGRRVHVWVCWVTDSALAQAEGNHQYHFPQHLVFPRDVPFEQAFPGDSALEVASQACKLPCTVCTCTCLPNHRVVEVVILRNSCVCWNRFSLGL